VIETNDNCILLALDYNTLLLCPSFSFAAVVIRSNCDAEQCISSTYPRYVGYDDQN